MTNDDDIAAAVLRWTIIVRELSELSARVNASDSMAETERMERTRIALIDEAVTPPQIGAKCALTGGRWYSYYEDAYVDSASGLDIDHMVPLAEAWDSGASAWTPQQR